MERQKTLSTIHFTPGFMCLKAFILGDTVAIETTPTFLTVGTIQHTILNFHLLKLHQTAIKQVKMFNCVTLL